MLFKPYKRRNEWSILSYASLNTKGNSEKKHVLYNNTSNSKKFGKMLFPKQEACSATAVLIAVIIAITTITSITKAAESCSVEHDLSQYKRAILVSRAEKRTEEKPKAKTGEAFPWKDIRLPSFVLPIRYDLLMKPNLKTFENSGSVNITFQVTASTNFIVLHSKDLNLSRILVTENDEREISVLQYLEYPEHEQLYIKIDGNFMPNLEYKLLIDFERNLEESMDGFYLSSYKTADGQKRYLATTNFEPTSARSAFPCFDEPAMKATFQLKMVHDKNYKAYFNSEAIQTEPYSEELSITSFQKTVKMSTYLVAFIVCDFRERQITNVDGINIRVLVPA
ncbi:Endoplasmic reticulum aminopeptidase 2, partial [Stegodyphus mimosarum]